MPEEVNVGLAETVKQYREVLDTVKDEVKGFDAKLDAKLDSLSGENKEKVEKMQSALDAFDKKHQEMVIAAKEKENKEIELQERCANLEKSILTNESKGTANFRETHEYKALNLYCKSGTGFMNAEEQKYLRTDVGAQGGFLVPEFWSSDMLKRIVEVSDIRRLSRVRAAAGVKTLNVPKRLTIPQARFEGEAEEATPSESGYGSVTMTAHRFTVVTPTTTDILEFSGFDMDSELSDDAITAFAQREGNRFLLGTGVKQPLGLLDPTANLETFDSAAAGVISLDDVILLSGKVKTGYQPLYCFNRETLAALRVEKDGNGNYLWRIGGETQPTLINGINFVVLPDMPNIAVNSLSVGLIDFFKAYNILDSVNLALIRDNVTEAAKAKVNFTWHKWLDGQPVLAEAGKLIKTKA